MTAPVIIPPITITQGKVFSQSYRIEDPTAPEDDKIISLEGVTAEVTLSPKPFDPPFFRAPVIIENDRLIVEISNFNTAAFPTLSYLGGKTNAVMQINISGPLPWLNQLWQCPAIIAGQFA